jgi:hypothetical protein
MSKKSIASGKLKGTKNVEPKPNKELKIMEGVLRADFKK